VYKTDRFPTGMHGRNMAFGSSVAVCPLLPATGFTRLRIDTLVRAREPLPIEARLSMQPFILRRRGLALRPVPAAGSTLPAYMFKTILKPIPDPLGL
jgi:hypothetical protein